VKATVAVYEEKKPAERIDWGIKEEPRDEFILFPGS